MNKILFILFFTSILTQAKAQLDSEAVIKNKTVKFNQKLTEGKFEGIDADFDSTMLSKLPAAKIQEVWESLPEVYGAFTGFDSMTLGRKDNFIYSQTRTRFKRGSLYQRIYFDSAMHVTGLFYIPVKYESGYDPPVYADQSKFHETKTEVITGEYHLPGIFTVPNEANSGIKLPVVILIQGSGPNGKDEEIGGCRPFQDLAWGLASRGFVVLRYDKRTFVYGHDINKTGLVTIYDEYLNDIQNAIALVKTKSYIDPQKIFVIGHSQGGMLIPLIAKLNPGLAGVVSLAGNARPIQDIIPGQMKYLTEGIELSPQQQLIIEKALANVKLANSDTLKPTTPGDMLPLGFPGSYWLGLRKYNQLKTAKKLGLPMLFMQGGRDYQVTLTDFDLWKSKLKKKKNVSFKLYPNLNHLLVEGTGASKPAEYYKPGNVSKILIEDLAAWMKGVSGSIK